MIKTSETRDERWYYNIVLYDFGIEQNNCYDMPIKGFPTVMHSSLVSLILFYIPHRFLKYNTLVFIIQIAKHHAMCYA